MLGLISSYKMNKRKLTSEEIEFLLDFIKPNEKIPPETANSVVMLSKKRFRKQLVDQILYPEVIPQLKVLLEKNYRESLIDPGTSVGILCAQSIGERQTQNTLNSIDWFEKILYLKNIETVVEPIGKMIDALLIENLGKIEYIPENRTEYLKLDKEYFIPSCDEDGMTNWYRIEAITKHLPVGKLVRVKTKSGRCVTATQSKSFLVWNNETNKFESTEGSNIKIGDILPTTKYLKRFERKLENDFFYADTRIILDREFGFFIGIYLNNNIKQIMTNQDIIERFSYLQKKYETVDDIHVLFDKITNHSEDLPIFSYNASDDYIKGLLSGFFRNCRYLDGDIESSCSNERTANGILFLLTYFKIFGVLIKKSICVLKVTSTYTKILETEIIEEIWKDIPSKFHVSKYQISNLGRLRNKFTFTFSNAIPRKDTGYLIFSINDDEGKQRNLKSSILVCNSFFPDEISDCVDHINQQTDDNRLSNLRWATYSENSTNKTFVFKKGKSVNQYDLHGNFIKNWEKIADVEKELKINHSNIVAVLNGRKKSTNGFVWEYHIEKNENEIWKKVPIDEIEDTYVSNFGRVRRRTDDHSITYGSLKKDGFVSISIPLKNSIEECKLTNERIKSKGFLVHRLIALTYLDNIENKPYVSHIDGNRINNNVNNLRWANTSEKNYSNINNDISSSHAADENKINCEKDVFLDEVISIEFVDPSKTYVYDLTVEKTRNFQLFNGLNVRDTLI